MTVFDVVHEDDRPWIVMELLRDYHGAVVPLIHAAEGTLDRFVGDGLLVFFNDPLPCPDAVQRVVLLAVGMRDAVAALSEAWARCGYRIGFGIGIARGITMLGQIGFAGRPTNVIQRPAFTLAAGGKLVRAPGGVGGCKGYGPGASS